MNLVINTDATDKTASAVDAVATRNVLTDLQQLSLGDTEPLTFTFCDNNGNTPSWVTDATYALSCGLGTQDIDANQLYTSTTSFQISGSTRVGTLNLNTTLLRNALWELMDAYRRGVFLVLQIRLVAPTGTVQTLAMLPVWVLNRVLSTIPTENSAPAPTGIIPLPSITALQGGSATCLDGIDDTLLPTGYTALLSYGRIPQTWQIFAGTDATNVSATPAIVRCKQYATSNRVWVQLM